VQAADRELHVFDVVEDVVLDRRLIEIATAMSSPAPMVA
jgi:hypothetical protein